MCGKESDPRLFRLVPSCFRRAKDDPYDRRGILFYRRKSNKRLIIAIPFFPPFTWTASGRSFFCPLMLVTVATAVTDRGEYFCKILPAVSGFVPKLPFFSSQSFFVGGGMNKTR